MNERERIATALLVLRLGVFVVMFMWTLDKFVNVPHASRVFENFYGLRGFGPGIMAAIGVAELLLILAFVVGYRKGVSYGGVLHESLPRAPEASIGFREPDYLDHASVPRVVQYRYPLSIASRANHSRAMCAKGLDREIFDPTSSLASK